MSTSVKFIRVTVGDGKIRELKGVGGGSAKYRQPENFLGNGQTWRIGIFQDDDTPLDVSDMASAKAQYQDEFSALAAHLSNALTLNSTTITKDDFESGTDWHYEIEFADGDMNPTKLELVDCVADDSGSLDGKFFTLYDADGSVGVWIDVDDSGTSAPAGATALDRQIEVTGISTDDDADAVATAIATALDADEKFNAVATGDKVAVTHEDSGVLTDGSDGDTGFSFSVPGEGLNGQPKKTFWLYLGGVTNSGNERTWAAEKVLTIVDDGSDSAPGSPAGGGVAATSADMVNLIRTICGKQSDAGGAPELTIASGAVSISQSLHRIDTEGDAASDDLDTINADFSLVLGDRLTIYPANGSRTVVVKHGTGNINCFGSADITLDEAFQAVELLFDGTNWMAFAAGGGGGGTSDHGSLTGLGDDDHTQYLRTDGARAGTGIQELLGLNLTDFAVKTLASDAITLTQTLTLVAAQSGTADDLATMTAGKGHGDLVILKADSGDTITIKHGTGNIQAFDGADIELSGDSAIAFIFDGTNWCELGNSRDQNSGGGSSLPVDDTTALVQDPVANGKKVRLDAGQVVGTATRAIQVPNADVIIWQAFTFELFDPTTIVNLTDYVELGWSMADFTMTHFGASVNTQGTGEDVQVELYVNGVSKTTITTEWVANASGNGESARKVITATDLTVGDVLKMIAIGDGSGSAGSEGQGLWFTIEGYFKLR